MAAPAVAALIAFLTGAGGAAAAPAWLAPAVRAETVIAGVEVDLARTCAATDPLIDALDDAVPGAAALKTITATADKVCADAKLPANPVDQARLIADAIRAFAAAAPLAARAAAPAPAIAAVHTR